MVDFWQVLLAFRESASKVYADSTLGMTDFFLFPKDFRTAKAGQQTQPWPSQPLCAFHKRFHVVFAEAEFFTLDEFVDYAS